MVWDDLACAVDLLKHFHQLGIFRDRMQRIAARNHIWRACNSIARDTHTKVFARVVEQCSFSITDSEKFGEALVRQ